MLSEKLIPYLRSEILECLAYKGRLSKSMVESMLQKHTHYTKTNHIQKHHHRPEILHAFDYLEAKRLIKKLNTDPGPGLIYGKGRPKTYFTITEEGLKILLADANVPAVRFWKIIHGYCINNDSLVYLDKIEEYYQILIRRYLKYPQRGFSSLLNVFHAKCNKWFQKTIIKSKKITSTQKIIEILAINPNLTREKLNELMTGGSLFEYYVLENDHTDLIISNIVSENYTDSKVTYDLSLFGIMFCLVLVHYNNIGRLRCGLHYKEFSVQEYYDKIASNYKMKLPLIFGKWNDLKRILKVHAVHNFNLILNEDEITSSDSVILEGNKELRDGIRTILSYNAKLMIDFAFAGQKFLAKAIHNMAHSSEFEKVFTILDKLNEVKMLLVDLPYAFPNDSGIYKKMEEFLPSKDIIRIQYRDKIFKKMEESFAEEITAFYYMNMNSNIPFMASSMRNHTSVVESSELSNHTPREYLSLIFQVDKEKPSLREWFSMWMKDLTSLQEEILQGTKKQSIL